MLHGYPIGISLSKMSVKIVTCAQFLFTSKKDQPTTIVLNESINQTGRDSYTFFANELIMLGLGGITLIAANITVMGLK